MDSINLLPQIAEGEIKKGVYKRKVNVAAIASLLVVAAVVVALFGYRLFLSSRDKTLTAETDAKIAEITSKENLDIEAKQRALVAKLDDISKFLSANKSTSKALKQVIDLASSGQVSLSKADIDSTGQVSVTGSAANSTTLGIFFDDLTSNGAKVTIDKVVASSVSNSAGGYQFTIRLTYTKPGLLEEKAQ